MNLRKCFRAVSDFFSLFFILPIRFYRRFISPLFPASCKYYPTCSAYAAEAYKLHGVIFGTILTVWRILRCNPWSKGGVDKVPQKITADYFIRKKKDC